jgi:hypothetical protein
MPPNTQGAVLLNAGRSVLDLNWQVKAWRFYGTPDGTAASGIRLNQGANGEVRFVMGWVAQQIARVGWHIDIDGKRLDDEEAKTMIEKVSNEESTIALSPEKIKELLGDAWDSMTGPGLPGEEDKKWLTVSVIDQNRRDILRTVNEKKEGLNLRAIWPHPAAPLEPDPPMKSILDVLEEIEQLGDLAYSQNRSRIANMGILTIANEMDLHNTLPNGQGANFASDVEQVINTPIQDPRRASAAPIIFRAPFEFMTGALSNGARGVQWTRPDLEYSESLESKMKFAIQRLAYGFPVAPEILLGMNSANRAVAFQVEESTYRSHIEPIARLVGRVYAKALQMILEGEKQIEVSPDATDLLARRHSVADAKDLYDRGLVRAKFVRRVAGVDEDEAATQEDLDRITLLRKGGAPGEARELDPSEVAGNEPVRASGELSAEGEDLSAALRGAIDMAQAAAISRVGATARTRLNRIPATPALELDPESVSNNRLPSLLGPDRLAELSLDLVSAIGPATAWLEDWLTARILECYPEVFGTDYHVEAVTTLKQSFQQWCFGTLCSWPATRAPAEFSDSVLEKLESVPPAPTEEEV